MSGCTPRSAETMATPKIASSKPTAKHSSVPINVTTHTRSRIPNECGLRDSVPAGQSWARLFSAENGAESSCTVRPVEAVKECSMMLLGPFRRSFVFLASPSFLFSAFLFFFLTITAGLLFATTPVVTVTLPAAGSQNESPVHFVASATSANCSKGIAAMRIYTAPHVGVYTVDSAHLDTEIPMGPGYFNTVIVAWDNCGGVTASTVDITVTNPNLAPPRFLYDTEGSTNKIAGFSVNAATGALTPLAQ